MATEFKLPELGENVTSGDVLRVMVARGDTIAPDQPVLELETDKATIEVPSPVGGRVTEIRVKAGDKVQVGQVILVVEDGAGAARGEAAAKAPASAPETPAPSAAEKKPAAEAAPQPDRRERKASAPDRAPARKPEPAAESQQDEPAAEPEPADVERGRERRGEVVEMQRAVRAAAEPQAPSAAPAVAAPAAPSTRRLARELGVDIDQVTGTGPDGRISQDDVKVHARRLVTGAGASRGGVPQGPLPDFARWGPIDRQPMRAIRRKTAEHLAQAWSAIPHVTQHDRADVTDLEAARKKYAPRVEAAGGGLTLTAIAVKIAAAAIREFPQVNASLDMANEQIVYKQYFHIGVAVDTDRGLLVPVIRDVDRKNLIEVSRELTGLAERARAGKLSLAEMQGGSFTITNLGGIGGTSFTPIVNFPEVAILGISRASMQPVFVDGQFQPRLMLPLSLSYDHRLVDGADAIRFLRWVVEALEQPFVLSLYG